ncbi:SgcJ/EcaC family oxidoreductase [Streptomyces sp. NBC_01233]|uniref:SgcJ/EcaC family oxidoreductase n=1 Tax=Streptomyces sp. NBC_01233 TaxID=2903787 RepID=UPI002E14A442|nr:SgcJ/EcaC family oxidoreductase [Streptomyces sp. NBC_01233]
MYEEHLTRCGTVILSHRTFEEFLASAQSAYETCTPGKPPSCFAILVGEIVEGEAFVHRVEFGRNVRSTDPAALDEFSATIVPNFGVAYDNEHRGFWCNSSDLLRIYRKADADGLEIIGSIHMHPDWHRIGPDGERGLTISAAPTPMDVYMFRNTTWPVNLICYLECVNQVVRYSLGAWRSTGDATCEPLAIQFTLDDKRASEADDDKAIRDIFADMMIAWSKGDGKDFTRAFAADADFTSVRCDHIDGSREIAAAHTRLFQSIYSGTRLTATVERVTYPRPDIAIVHVDTQLARTDGTPAEGVGGNPGNSMHAQSVLERRGGSWEIISFMNMVPMRPLAG